MLLRGQHARRRGPHLHLHSDQRHHALHDRSANKGWKKACQDDKALARGINTYDGKVYFKGVSDALGYELHCTCDILK